MAFVPGNDIVEVELFQRLHGQRVENTLYFRLVGGFGAAEVVDLWNHLLTWWTSDFSVPLSADLTLTGGKITDLSTDTSPAYVYTAPTPNPAGGSSNPALPGNVSIVASFRTSGRGRSSRGRNYVAGLTEPSVTGNTLDAATIASLQTSYSHIAGLAFDNPWEWGVFSRIHLGAPRVAGVFQLITSTVIVDPYVDSQRRRLTGRGL